MDSVDLYLGDNSVITNTVMLIMNILSTLLVLVELKVYNCGRVMVYKPTIYGDKEENGFPFKSGSFLVFYLATVDPGLFIR